MLAQPVGIAGLQLLPVEVGIALEAVGTLSVAY